MKVLKFFLLVSIIFTACLRLLLFFAPSVKSASIDSASLMQKINAERSNRNLPALLVSSKLSSAAAKKTLDMFNRVYFDHVDPDGHYVWPLIEEEGYKPYRMLGENLAIDFSTEDGIIRAWINSPTHRDNLLRSEFADQGLSAQFGDFEKRHTSIVTSLFGTLVNVIAPVNNQSPVKSKPANTTPANNQATKSTETITYTKPADSPPRASGKNEPAIQLTAPGDSKSSLPDVNSIFNLVSPTKFSSDEIDLYQTVRTIFLVLVIALGLTIFTDAVFSRKRKDLWGNSQLPLVLLVLLVSIITLNLY